jgi:hypothetical protein
VVDSPDRLAWTADPRRNASGATRATRHRPEYGAGLVIDALKAWVHRTIGLVVWQAECLEALAEAFACVIDGFVGPNASTGRGEADRVLDARIKFVYGTAEILQSTFTSRFGLIGSLSIRSQILKRRARPAAKPVRHYASGTLGSTHAVERFNAILALAGHDHGANEVFIGLQAGSC